MTAKLAMLATVATLAIGGLIAAQMAAGQDPALGPKASARAKKVTTTTSSPSSNATETDPNSEDYGYYGSSSGYSSGSGYSTQQSSPAPVTSSTS
ncbi:MAG TPA: hypothetical protein VEL05_06560 [Candidatus Acidoferrum sp.]|nr:hypothetical protein [Candidatus Acidoferrum sp.]